MRCFLKHFAVVLFLGVGVVQGAVITSGFLNEAVFAKDSGSFSITLSDGFHLAGYLAPLDMTAPGELVNRKVNRLNTTIPSGGFSNPLISGIIEINDAGSVSGSLMCGYNASGPDPRCALPSREPGLPYELVTGYGTFTGNVFTFAAPIPEPSTLLLLALPAAVLVWKRRKVSRATGR